MACISVGITDHTHPIEYFTGAMVLYSSTLRNDGAFRCGDGEPVINPHEPLHNLTALRKVPVRDGYENLDKLDFNLKRIVHNGTCVYHYGIGGQELVAKAKKRMAHLFSGGIFVWAF